MTSYTVWPRQGTALKVLERDVAWVCLPCSMIEELSGALGLHPASADVLEAEHSACHARLERFAILAPALHQLATLAGQTLARGLPQLSDALDGIEPELLEDLCCRAAYNGAVAALAILADDGLIALPAAWGAP